MQPCTHPNVTYSEADCVETHGLECGPYERWKECRYECRDCGEYWTPKEFDAEMAAIESSLEVEPESAP